MRYLFVLLFLFACFISGCAGKTVDSNLKPYITSFEEIYSVSVQVDAGFSALDAPVIGECIASGSILISPTFWNENDGLEREAVVFHELGHCVFGRQHTSELYADSCPKSFMNPQIPSLYCVQKYHDEYIKELGAAR